MLSVSDFFSVPDDDDGVSVGSEDIGRELNDRIKSSSVVSVVRCCDAGP